jgi:hypothetical protein
MHFSTESSLKNNCNYISKQHGTHIVELVDPELVELFNGRRWKRVWIIESLIIHIMVG